MNTKLYVSYGQQPIQMIKELLAEIDLKSLIPPDAKVGLKPNLVVARPAEEGATTCPRLVEGVIQYLQEQGLDDIVIAEGSWIGDRTERAFKACGYTALADKYGITLVDLQKDSYHVRTGDGLELQICDTMSKIDFLINLPVLKGHCQTKITGALKNLKGCIPNQEKRRFHTLGLHRPIAYLNKVLKTDLIIVDGLIGDLDFEEGGNPVQMDRVIVGTDPVLVDSYLANLLGYAAEEIPYLVMAAELGVGQLYQSTTVVEEFNTNHTVSRIAPSREVQKLASLVVEQEACSACYGSLIHSLARLNEQGSLHLVPVPISIGQGFKGQKHEGIGVGNCCRGFARYVPGCPPTAKAIRDFLQNN